MPRKPPSESVLARAAELRALGNNWVATAKELKRSARNIRRWPRLYPERWAAALNEAQRWAIGDLAGESLEILRRLLHSDDEKIRRDAAALLTDLRLKQARFDLKAGAATTAVSALAQLLARLLENYTHEELEQRIEVLDSIPLPEPHSHRPVFADRAG
jgi:hypothetical protein